jgi:hypothetical protein
MIFGIPDNALAFALGAIIAFVVLAILRYARIVKLPHFQDSHGDETTYMVRSGGLSGPDTPGSSFRLRAIKDSCIKGGAKACFVTGEGGQSVFKSIRDSLDRKIETTLISGPLPQQSSDRRKRLEEIKKCYEQYDGLFHYYERADRPKNHLFYAEPDNLWIERRHAPDSPERYSKGVIGAKAVYVTETKEVIRDTIKEAKELTLREIEMALGQCGTTVSC